MSGEERIEQFVDDKLEAYLLDRIIDAIEALTNYRIAKAKEEEEKKKA